MPALPWGATTYSMMRGSTLLLHLREATHFVNPTPKRRSPIRNCRPSTVYRLAATPTKLLLFITVGEHVYLYGTSIQEKGKRCKWFLVLDNKEICSTIKGVQHWYSICTVVRSYVGATTPS